MEEERYEVVDLDDEKEEGGEEYSASGAPGESGSESFFTWPLHPGAVRTVVVILSVEALLTVVDVVAVDDTVEDVVVETDGA